MHSFILPIVRGLIHNNHKPIHAIGENEINDFNDVNKYFINYQYLPCNESSEVALLLVHGFGANHHHWRSNVPVLSQKYDTYAIDLFGFGNSSQFAELPYTISFWTSQVVYFIENVIKRPCILVGNSLGGYIILNSAIKTSNVIGIIAINPLIISKNKPIKMNDSNWYYSKYFVQTYFYYLKNKKIIKYFLDKLYPIFPKKIDEYLLNSLYYPACNTNASAIFYKIFVENIVNPSIFIEDILSNITIPMLFIYGEKDIWINSKTSIELTKHYPKMEYINVVAGHCPHDEIPEIVNDIILNFTTKIVY